MIVAICGIEIEIFQLLVTREWVFNFSHHRGKTLCVERGEISEPAPAFEIFEEKIDRCPFATGINMMLQKFVAAFCVTDTTRYPEGGIIEITDCPAPILGLG